MSRTLHRGASKLISGGAGYFGVTPCSLSCLQCALSLPLCYLMRPAGGKYIFSFWRKLSLPGLLADVSPLLCYFHSVCACVFFVPPLCEVPQTKAHGRTRARILEHALASAVCFFHCFVPAPLPPPLLLVCAIFSVLHY